MHTLYSQMTTTVLVQYSTLGWAIQYPVYGTVHEAGSQGPGSTDSGYNSKRRTARTIVTRHMVVSFLPCKLSCAVFSPPAYSVDFHLACCGCTGPLQQRMLRSTLKSTPWLLYCVFVDGSPCRLLTSVSELRTAASTECANEKKNDGRVP